MTDRTEQRNRGPGFAMVNEEMVPATRAAVSIFDRGFLWGDGVYEVIPCFNGTLFRLPDHLDRLQASLSYVAIEPQLSTEEWINRTNRLMIANSKLVSAHPICRVGHWVSRGIEDWSPFHEARLLPTLVSFVAPVLQPLDRSVYEEGLELTVVPNRRSSAGVLDPRAKITSKLNLIIADIQAGPRGKLPLLLDERGFVTESSTSNFFIVSSGSILTSGPEQVLGGITRGVVIEIALELGIEVQETDLAVSDVAEADEIFLTSSTWGVVPVRAVDDIEPKTTSHRPITKRLIEKLASLTGFNPLA